ncbi:MAG TPA: cytochrome c biogenesis protein CcsA [Pyrinomonadaceae bacterium]|jgi:ABC-type transport system involved in cytochrome c biogenesis permease subunit|nr:cytochrome c biogenesis protein CcsA [Pyrinomonadaceae bacterium]
MAQTLTVEELSENAAKPSNWRSFLPAFLAIGGAFLMLFARLQIGGSFIGDASLMMLALACYLLAAIFGLTNLYAASNMARKMSFALAVLGVFFNLSSWLVRWVNGYDHEIALLRASGNPITPWLFRYIPFANLYDLSLAFAFGAGIATLLIANRDKFKFLATFTLPLAALILTLARFIGGEFIDLPPVLDSYWRPIHVGVASLSYGVALVCFAVAVMYLLKDGVKVESMAVWASLFAFMTIATVSKFSVLTEFVYRAGLFIPNPGGRKPFEAPFRLDIPWLGPTMALAGLLSLAVAIAFALYLYKNLEIGKTIGHLLLKASLVVYIAAIVIWVAQVNSIPAAQVNGLMQKQTAATPAQLVTAGKEIAKRQGADMSQVTSAQFSQVGREYLQSAGPQMYVSLGTNPVEFAGLLTAATGLFFCILFAFRTSTLRGSLPSLESLDNLMYKTASVAFAGLAMLLITGAIWANESWGRPWGFDSKETGALVAWLTYAAFLHTRIARNWTGRSSAYFAVLAFAFVIFTYLGVSYLLPGLHSYA